MTCSDKTCCRRFREAHAPLTKRRRPRFADTALPSGASAGAENWVKMRTKKRNFVASTAGIERSSDGCSMKRFDYRTGEVKSKVRILHVLDAQAEFQTRRGVEALQARLGVDFECSVRFLKSSSARDLATAGWALRQLGRDHFDLVHAWGTRALTAAAMGARGPILYTPDAAASQKAIAWARAVAEYRLIEIVCSTATQRRMHVERGIPVDRCHLIRPGVDFSRVRPRRDKQQRARFGFGDEDRVLLACGESTQASNHRETIWAGAILHLLDSRYRVLVWGEGSWTKNVRDLANASKLAGAFVFASDQLGPVDFEMLLPAADAIAINARGAVATLPIAIAMASGLPIVSTVTYTTSELLEDRHTALMVPPGRARQFARRVLDLYQDPRLQWSIAETARAEAYEYYSLTRYLDEFRSLYRRAAGIVDSNALEPHVAVTHAMQYQA